MALLILGGPWYLPAVLAAHLASAFLITPFLAGHWEQLALPVVKTLGYAITAWLVRRKLGAAPIPKSRRESAMLIAATFAAPLPGVLLTTIFLRHAGIATESATLAGSVLRWLGGACSILTFVPAAVVYLGPRLYPERRPNSRPISPRGRAEILLQSVALLLTFWILQAWPPLGGARGLPLYFVPLAWIALSQGLPGATLAVLAIYLGNFSALWLHNAPPQVLIDFVFFSLAYAVVGLGLGTAVSLRGQAEADLAMSKERLAQVHAALPAAVQEDAALRHERGQRGGQDEAEGQGTRRASHVSLRSAR